MVQKKPKIYYCTSTSWLADTNRSIIPSLETGHTLAPPCKTISLKTFDFHPFNDPVWFVIHTLVLLLKPVIICRLSFSIMQHSTTVGRVRRGISILNANTWCLPRGLSWIKAYRWHWCCCCCCWWLRRWRSSVIKARPTRDWLEPTSILSGKDGNFRVFQQPFLLLMCLEGREGSQSMPVVIVLLSWHRTVIRFMGS